MGGRRLEGRRAVVTAATDGIGLAIARRLCAEGCEVLLSSRKQANVDRAVAELRSTGTAAPVHGCVCHVGRAEDRERLRDEVARLWGPFGFDIFVSNAAVNPTVESVLEIGEATLDKMIDVNLKSALLLTQALAPMLRDSGAVLYVSSVLAYRPAAPLGFYGVTKTALLGLTQAVAQELGPRGVRVNCLAPGIVPTKFSAALVRDPDAARAQADRTLLQRLGTPEEIAGAAAFLCSDDAAYVTGETLVAAGGMHARL